MTAPQYYGYSTLPILLVYVTKLQYFLRDLLLRREESIYRICSRSKRENTWGTKGIQRNSLLL